MNGINVIISNKNQALLLNLDIDVIKHITGEFTIEDLTSQFTNFYYNKMIIDITAIKNYENINVIQALSVKFDASKIILLLDDSEKVNSPLYLSQLVSMGIYNFTKNIDSVKYLIDNPNTYKDVASFHQLNGVVEKPILNENTYDNTRGFIGQRIIGFKNLTASAGSTTLVYLLKKILSRHYSVAAVEVDKRDFIYFNDKDMFNTTSNEIGNTIVKYSDKDILLVDINSSKQAESLCHDVLYLVEPSIIKLNKLMMLDRNILAKLKKDDKKLILSMKQNLGYIIIYLLWMIVNVIFNL